MDNLGYNYYPNTNQLSSVTDAAASTLYPDDVDTQVANNYAYDGSGNLIQDLQSGILSGGITWSPYGKLMTVNQSPGKSITFGYDAQQNRTLKRRYDPTKNPVADTSSYYVYDLQGNVLAVYESFGSTVRWKEQHLYGSSRLGIIEPNVSWTSAPAGVPYFRSNPTLNLGNRRYELVDYLGNVRSIINDRRSLINAGNSSTQYYTATLLGGTDYYPFGSQMRSSTLAKYRYGFNTQEKVDEIALGHTTAMFWEYDANLGRRWNLDPVSDESESRYAVNKNNPIYYNDPNGDCPWCPFVVKGVSSAAVDYFLQGAFNVASGMNIEEAFSLSNIDKTDVFISGLQGALPWTVPGGKYSKAAIAALSDIGINYGKAVLSGKEYSTSEAGRDFLIGFVSQLGAEKASEFFGDKKILGGKYEDIEITRGKHERNHMPANSVSPYSTKKGDAIRMDIDDHRKTKSWGSSKKAQEYRKEQKKLIDQGKYEEAQQMDIDDVKEQFGRKYDKAIKQMKKNSRK